MLVLSVKGLAKSFGARTLFTGVSLEIHAGEKVALFGPNGCGKSTLLEIIAGHMEPDAGYTWIQPKISVGYLPQAMQFDDEARPSDICRDPAVLGRFGIERAAASMPMASLSAGQRTRARLAQVWAAQPDLVILDEPTNHLDAPAMDLLAHLVREAGAAVLLVSHDRYFLDLTVQRIVELTPQGARSYPGAYTSFRARKQDEIEAATMLYERQEQEEARLERLAARQMEWFRQAHRQAGQNDFARARAKKGAARARASSARLERFRDQRIDKPRRPDGIAARMGRAQKTGRRIIHAQGISKTFSAELFSPSDVAVMRQDRVAIVGPNGSGKTTLLRILLGLEPHSSGGVWRSPTASFFYFDQTLQQVEPSQTVFESVYRAADRTPQEIRDILGALLFRGDNVFKRVGVLSLGERVRLAFGQMMARDYDVLALDEPTNNLDVESREAIERCLEAWDGTLIVISHDRYLLNRLCTTTVSIEDRTVRTYHGPPSDLPSDSVSGATTGSSADSSADHASAPDEAAVLILENRLAQLAARLSDAHADCEEKAQTEREFMTISRELARLRRRV